MRYGQFLRLFVSVNDDPDGLLPVCAATSCTLHISAQTENSTTKDTEGDWEDYEVTGLSYDISGEANVQAPFIDDSQQLAELIEMMENSDKKAWQLVTTLPTEGDQNRDIDQVICSGVGTMSSLQVNAPNRQNATLSFSISNYGALTIPS